MSISHLYHAYFPSTVRIFRNNVFVDVVWNSMNALEVPRIVSKQCGHADKQTYNPRIPKAGVHPRLPLFSLFPLRVLHRQGSILTSLLQTYLISRLTPGALKKLRFEGILTTQNESYRIVLAESCDYIIFQMIICALKNKPKCFMHPLQEEKM